MTLCLLPSMRASPGPRRVAVHAVAGLLLLAMALMRPVQGMKAASSGMMDQPRDQHDYIELLPYDFHDYVSAHTREDFVQHKLNSRWVKYGSSVRRHASEATAEEWCHCLVKGEACRQQRSTSAGSDNACYQVPNMPIGDGLLETLCVPNSVEEPMLYKQEAAQAALAMRETAALGCGKYEQPMLQNAIKKMEAWMEAHPHASSFSFDDAVYIVENYRGEKTREAFAAKKDRTWASYAAIYKNAFREACVNVAHELDMQYTDNANVATNDEEFHAECARVTNNSAQGQGPERGQLRSHARSPRPQDSSPLNSPTTTLPAWRHAGRQNTHRTSSAPTPHGDRQPAGWRPASPSGRGNHPSGGHKLPLQRASSAPGSSPPALKLPAWHHHDETPPSSSPTSPHKVDSGDDSDDGDSGVLVSPPSTPSFGDRIKMKIANMKATLGGFGGGK